jgi:hypothetical protein
VADANGSCRSGVAVRMAVLYLLLGSGVDLKPEVIGA